MDLVRIGEKLISRQKLYSLIDNCLDLRTRGYSQQEVANRLKTDRSLISRLESYGEIRKGKTIGVIGFPIQNCSVLEAMLLEEGADFFLLLSETERRRFLTEKSGLELFNTILELLTCFRAFNTVIVIGSDQRIKLITSLLNNEVIGVEIGESPLAEDCYLDPERIRGIIRSIKVRDLQQEG